MRNQQRYKVITFSKEGKEIDKDEGLTPFQALNLAHEIRNGEGGFIVHVRPPLPENVLKQSRSRSRR